MSNSLEELTKKVGVTKAKQIVKLIKDCDDYLTKFRNKIDPLLDSINQEVKIGIVFSDKNKEN